MIEAALLGKLLALASASSFALANVFIARTKASGGDKGVMFSVLVTMALSAVLWLALELPYVGFPSLADQSAAIGFFILAGLLAMVFGRTLVFESIRRLGVTRSAAVKRLNPFFSVVLAAALLSEPIGRLDLAGMAAIAAAFALLIRESFRARGRLAVEAPAPIDYMFGIGGALAYALAYVVRKAGLTDFGAPAFGTLVSAAAGFVFYLLLASVSTRYRGYLAAMFSHLDRWVVLSAVLISMGQILMFAALAHERVSVVVMIASMEIFISLVLSVWVFRSERLPGAMVLVAAALALAGVILVAVN